jgi:hypothetical protein
MARPTMRYAGHHAPPVRPKPGQSGERGRLAQRESASFTPRRSLVRSQYRPRDGLRCSLAFGHLRRGPQYLPGGTTPRCELRSRARGLNKGLPPSGPRTPRCELRPRGAPHPAGQVRFRAGKSEPECALGAPAPGRCRPLCPFYLSVRGYRGGRPRAVSGACHETLTAPALSRRGRLVVLPRAASWNPLPGLPAGILGELIAKSGTLRDALFQGVIIG